MFVSFIDALIDVFSCIVPSRMILLLASCLNTLLRLYEAVIREVLTPNFLLAASLLRILSIALT